MGAKQTGMLIATLFLARDLAHRAHLKVSGPGSYAIHAGALDPFYNGIVPLADHLSEAYQGRFNTLLDIPLLAHDGKSNITDTLASQLEWIHAARYDCFARDESALHNIVDEIEALYMVTLYKLRTLS